MMIQQESKRVGHFNILMQYNCVNTKTGHLLVNYYKLVIIISNKSTN